MPVAGLLLPAAAFVSDREREEHDVFTAPPPLVPEAAVPAPPEVGAKPSAEEDFVSSEEEAALSVTASVFFSPPVVVAAALALDAFEDEELFPVAVLPVVVELELAEAAVPAEEEEAGRALALCQLVNSWLTKCRSRSRYWLYSSTSLCPAP